MGHKWLTPDCNTRVNFLFLKALQNTFCSVTVFISAVVQFLWLLFVLYFGFVNFKCRRWSKSISKVTYMLGSSLISFNFTQIPIFYSHLFHSIFYLFCLRCYILRSINVVLCIYNILLLTALYFLVCIYHFLPVHHLSRNQTFPKQQWLIGWLTRLP